MPLKNFFRSKTVKQPPDPRLRWFGKLPTYPDYYSSGTDEPWAVEFNEWVLKGFELYRSRLAGVGRSAGRLPVGGCILRLGKSEMTVFATVLDYGGDMRGRPFPMCFYVGVPSAVWPGPTSDRVAPASRVLRDLLALRLEVPRFLNSPGRFEDRFGQRTIDLSGLDHESTDQSWLAAGKALLLAEWFSRAQAMVGVSDLACWQQIIAQRGEDLARHATARFNATVRFPLVMGLSWDAQIGGWIHWIESRFNLTDRPPSLVLSGDTVGQAGFLTVIARDLVPDDFLVLRPMAPSLPYVEDLVGFGEGTDSTGESCRAVGSGIDSSMTWTDFISGATGGT